MTLTTDTPLFDLATMHRTAILPDDSNRTGRNMPPASHAAGDRSQATVKEVRAGVIRLLEIYGPSTGAELNKYYADTWDFWDLQQCAHDSPRKRAAELAADEVIRITNPGSKSAAIYALPETEKRNA